MSIIISSGDVESGIILENDTMTVLGGGIANNILVNSNAALHVSSGGKVTGKMTFAPERGRDGAFVDMYEGAILDFDLTQTQAGSEALVNNLSIIQGTPLYTLSVDGTEAEGVYTLANGAADFAGTISVVSTSGESLGTLAVGEKVYIGKDDYTLTLTDDVLSVAINAPTVTEANGDVLLEGTMPKARYMYGCVNTSISMILGYYDLYGYRGEDLSEVIEGDVELDTRGTGYDIYMMDDFDSVLGRANASRDYVERFFSKDPIEVINARTETETTPAEELPYSFVNDGAGPELRTDVWNCLADYLGTGQFWRGNDNLSATSSLEMLEVIQNDNKPFTVTDEATGIQRTIDHKYTSCLYGLYLYVRDKGFDLDRKTTKILQADVAGGVFTFDDYMKEIDAGRPVMVLVTGHAMVGYGYNAETREIIIDNCYQSDQRMVWDGVYDFAGERTLEAICTFGFMTTDADIDLAVSPFDEDSGAAGKLIVTTAEGQQESVDCCFVGSPLYLSFAVSNQGTTASGAFDIAIYCDGEEKENIPSLSLEAEAIRRVSDIPLGADFGVGLHSIGVRIDPDNEIQELYALNNSDERSVMVLKEGTNVVEGTKTVASGGVSKDDYVMNGAEIRVLEGGTAEGTLIQGKVTSRSLDGKEVKSTPGFVNVSAGGLIRNATVYEYGQLELSGTAEDLDIREHGNAVVSSGGIVSGASVDKDGILDVESGGKLTGETRLGDGAKVSFGEGGILNFDLTGTTAGAAALVNNLSIIQGAPLYTLTVDSSQSEGVYTLAKGAADFTGTISVVNTSGESLGMLTVGTTATIDGMEYLLTNENDELSVTVKAGTPVPPKWTYMVYMAADNDLCHAALYDIVSMQQARIDPEIEIYILVDRTPVGSKDSGDYVTPHGTYKWDSLWPETRVGKITYSPGLTVTVDWESWGELDTGSIGTLTRFVDWAQEQSSAENYGLIMWDHGGESAELCWDLTTNSKWEASLTISEVSGLLKEKGNIPLVIFNNCLLGSEITVTQMAGSTEIIVASEPISYSESTFNYNVFFSTITADMTAQEMAQIMVLNMESSGTGITTMLSSVDVTVSRLAAPLEALAGAVAASGNLADRSVLINAMLKAPQDGCLYDGSEVQQSDLGFLLTRAMEDRDYENTSGGFQKALLDVMTALNESVLEFRSLPANRGSGVAFFNTVCTVEKIASDSSPEKANAAIKSHITSYYKSNPLWGGLLYDLGATYLAENEDKLFPVPTFTVRDVGGLVKDRTVSVSDFGCFSGLGESFAGIKLIDEFFFSFIVTAADKSAGKFRAVAEDDAQIAVSLLASDGTVIATGTDGVSFENLAPGEYFVRLQSDRNCRVTVDTYAEFKTGVDRFDYAGSGKNEKYANGNGSITAATVLAEGFYDGLLTYRGDTDYYLIGDIHTERYKIVIEGEEGLTVAEFDGDGTLVRSAGYKDGKYTLTMDSMDYLLVEGVDELEESLNAYSFRVTGLENGSGDIVLDDLCGTKDEVSWISSTIVNDYELELSMDDFGHVLQFTTAGTAVDLLNLPAGTYQWRVGANVEGAVWYDGDDFVSDNTKDEPKVFQSRTDAGDDLFFAAPNGTWGSRYYAKHVGTVDGWEGTGELVSAAGKGRIQDLFFGSADPGTLFLTDSENGDALFLDDVYTGLPEEIGENTARLCRLHVIKAGAGDDIIDMTSRRFEYLGKDISLCGGDGDDVIWAGSGKNTLYGDAGNDRIVGASGDDVIVGGIGDDTMHGGGGNDIFTFCKNWGVDEVEQLADGWVTLWFVDGSMDNWDAAALTYTDGENSVAVSGVSADQVALKFGNDKSELYETLSLSGAFNGAISQRIFDLTVEPESDENFLAEV